MNTDRRSDRSAAEGRFADVFAHLDFIVQYAHRRGAGDPHGIASEAMAIAWRRLADVPVDDARPWLIVTTRNLMMAEHRRASRERVRPLEDLDVEAPAEPMACDSELDPALIRALRRLSEPEREALLLVAWEDLTPAQAARSLGISATSFRVRLHRARRRLGEQLARQPLTSISSPTPHTEWRRTA